MNIFVVLYLTITLILIVPFANCKPKKNRYGAKYPNTQRPRRTPKTEKKVYKTIKPPNNSKEHTATTTPTAETPLVVSSRKTKKGTREVVVEPTQKTEQENSQPLTVSNVKTQEPTKKMASKEPSTAKDKSNMKTARRIIVPRKEEFFEDQNEDETLICVKSIE